MQDGGDIHHQNEGTEQDAHSAIKQTTSMSANAPNNDKRGAGKHEFDAQLFHLEENSL